MERILGLQKDDTIIRCCYFQQKVQKYSFWYSISSIPNNPNIVVYQSERKIEDS